VVVVLTGEPENKITDLEKLPSMLFDETKLPGVFEIHLDPHRDDRGFFARTWCQREFEAKGLNPKIAQCNISFNPRKGTLRGIHFQMPPSAEAKLVRCTKGAIYDVVLDLRSQSLSFGEWIGVTLSAANRDMIYVPEGCAHGFITLEDDTEVFYQMSQFYDAGTARGVRWNDPGFQIEWPLLPQVISERDQTYPDFQ
jgi:dTDP-4-dehydrorhamnose 3,5-epimerase